MEQRRQIAAALTVFLAGALILLGGAKLLFLVPAYQGTLQGWAAATEWRAALVGAGLLEIGLAVYLLWGRLPSGRIVWALRLLAVYGVLQIASEVSGLSLKNCGCFGPIVDTTLAAHVGVTGVLLGVAWAAYRLVCSPQQSV